MTFGIFGVAFAARPVGALFFGSYGDRHGRRNTLAIVVLLMALATTLVGVLPTYASIGVGAPLLLVLLRLLQGFSAGGEFGGATAFLAEYAPDGKRGLYACWQGFTQGVAALAVAGLGATLTATLAEGSFESSGWRIPFLLAAPLGLAGLYVRLRLEETPHFRALASSEKVPSAPLREMVSANGRALLTAIGLIVAWTVSIYTFVIYMPTYLTETLGLPFGSSLTVNVIGLVVHSAVIPPLAILSDRIGRRPIVLAGSIGVIVLTYPGYLLMSGGSLALIIPVQIVLATLVACFAGPLPAALSELFSTRVRYSGLSLAYSIGVGIFGGLAPIIATALLSGTGSDVAVAFYPIGAAVLTLIAALVMVETAREPLRDV